MRLKGGFWRFAHKRYQIRKPNRVLGPALILFGGFFGFIYVLAAASAPNQISDPLGFLLGLTLLSAAPLTVGILYWRIRREWKKGPGALYRKRLETSPRG